MTIFTCSDAEVLRSVSGDSRITSKELFKADSDGHKFKAGDVVTLVGLADFPEFNGQQVEILSIRADGLNGKAYYVKGSVNQFVNWIYEYRLA